MIAALIAQAVADAAAVDPWTIGGGVAGVGTIGGGSIWLWNIAAKVTAWGNKTDELERDFREYRTESRAEALTQSKDIGELRSLVAVLVERTDWIKAASNGQQSGT